MIGRLKGILVERHLESSIAPGVLVIDCHGVGYEVLPTRRLNERVELGDECTVIVHTDVKEDSIKLFGFADKAEREIFNLLLKVTGIGTKTARDIISGMEPSTLLRAIGHGDISRLQSIKGIGKKTAERIVLELRDLVAKSTSADVAEGSLEGKSSVVSGAQVTEDAIAALIALGFGRGEAEKAVKKVTEKLPLEKTISQNKTKNGDALLDSGRLVAAALQYV